MKPVRGYRGPGALTRSLLHPCRSDAGSDATAIPDTATAKVTLQTKSIRAVRLKAKFSYSGTDNTGSDSSGRAFARAASAARESASSCSPVSSSSIVSSLESRSTGKCH
jgi:hypothetical protein